MELVPKDSKFWSGHPYVDALQSKHVQYIPTKLCTIFWKLVKLFYLSTAFNPFVVDLAK